MGDLPQALQWHEFALDVLSPPGMENECWGNDVNGALGTGTASYGYGRTASYNAGCSPSPVQVTGGLVFNLLAVGGQLEGSNSSPIAFT